MTWLSAAEAMSRLKIRPQTLYAYVSRGRVEARPDPADPRRSLYSAEDVSALTARRGRSRKLSAVAQDAIAWGEPVLSSALTTVTRGRLYYRGRDAIALSERATLEEAAELFWSAPYAASAAPSAPDEGGVRARLFAALAARAGEARSALGRPKALLAEEAALVLETMVEAVAGQAAGAPIHERLARFWALDARGADIVRRALVLLMDHELNASTFAVRVTASTGASLAACALTGLATLSGPLHGAAVRSVMKFATEGARLGAHAAVRARLDENLMIPGFGHNLYPEGDPRAVSLLDAMHAGEEIRALCAAVRAEAGLEANVDLAMAAMALELGIGEDVFAIFAIGRAVGWMGHAIEQLESGSLIRPRARYVGAAPEMD